MKYVTLGIVKTGFKEWAIMTWDANAECYLSYTSLTEKKCG
jgi:hypothetical protein